MVFEHLRLDIQTIEDQPVATVCLNRPETGNALDATLIDDMHRAFDQLEQMPVRLLQLTATGKHFCTGADLKWMQQAKQLSKAENYRDALQLARLIQRLDQLPLPTIAVVQGAAFGGALGLITACDFAIAAESAQFCLSEVRLGLIPAIIAPYIVRAMGERQARRYCLSGETITSQQALSLNLIHECCPEQNLLSVVDVLCKRLIRNGPTAMAETKQLLKAVGHSPIDDQLIQQTCAQIASVRISPEAQERLTAFLARRSAGWKKTNSADE